MVDECEAGGNEDEVFWIFSIEVDGSVLLLWLSAYVYELGGRAPLVIDIPRLLAWVCHAGHRGAPVKGLNQRSEYG